MIELDWGRKYRGYLVLEEKDLDAFDGHLSALEKYYEEHIPASGSQEKLESLKRIRKELEESVDLIERVEI